MKYEPERPDEIHRIRLNDGVGVSDERQEELRYEFDMTY